MKPTSMTCPFIKQVVMMYCDACPTKKMVPLDQLVSASPCMAQSFEDCPIYRDAVRRVEASAGNGEPEPVGAGTGREVFP